MKTFVSTVNSALFDDFLGQVWEHVCRQSATPLLLKQPVPSAEQRIGELPTSPQPASYAVSPLEAFASFRWWLPSPDDDALSTGYCEAFCLPSGADGQQARIGFVTNAVGAEPNPGIAELLEWGASRGLNFADPAKPAPSFVELSALLASRGRVSSSNMRMTAQLDEAQAELGYYRRLVAEQDEELRLANARIRDLQEAAPWSHAAPVSVEDTESETYPEDLEQLPQWCEERKDRLAVAPRALGGAKKALYERPSLIYAGLEFLAGPYRDARLGKLSATEMESALLKSGLRLAGSAGPSVAGAQGEAYYLAWQGRRRFLDLHLLRGGGRDERYCLRIYFFWDDATQRCVVGWLPSHLSNSLS